MQIEDQRHNHVMEENTLNCSSSEEVSMMLTSKCSNNPLKLPQTLNLAGESVLYLGQTLDSKDYCLLSMGWDGQVEAFSRVPPGPNSLHTFLSGQGTCM